jgi:hypothetical protein
VKSLLRYAIFLTMILLSGCLGTNATKPDSCSWDKIITVSKDDKLTRITAEEIVAHNDSIRKLCK